MKTLLSLASSTLLLALASAGCTADATLAADEEIDTQASAIVSTWYASNWVSRTIYAAGPVNGTYNVDIQSRGRDGKCKARIQKTMNRETNVSQSLAASLGLNGKEVNASGEYKRSSDGTWAAVWYLTLDNFTYFDNRNIAYRVTRNVNGRVTDDSGWQPGDWGC